MQTKQRLHAQLNRCFCGNLSDSTVHMESVQLLLVSPEGHVMSGSKCSERLHSEACMVDLTWALVRMPPLNMFWVDLFPSEKQTVPGRSGFNAVVHSCVTVLTNIRYCPVIDGSPTEFWPSSAIMYCTFFLNVYPVLNSDGEPSIYK